MAHTGPRAGSGMLLVGTGYSHPTLLLLLLCSYRSHCTSQQQQQQHLLQPCCSRRHCTTHGLSGAAAGCVCRPAAATAQQQQPRRTTGQSQQTTSMCWWLDPLGTLESEWRCCVMSVCGFLGGDNRLACCELPCTNPNSRCKCMVCCCSAGYALWAFSASQHAVQQTAQPATSPRGAGFPPNYPPNHRHLDLLLAGAAATSYVCLSLFLTPGAVTCDTCHTVCKPLSRRPETPFLKPFQLC